MEAGWAAVGFLAGLLIGAALMACRPSPGKGEGYRPTSGDGPKGAPPNIGTGGQWRVGPCNYQPDTFGHGVLRSPPPNPVKK